MLFYPVINITNKTYNKCNKMLLILKQYVLNILLSPVLQPCGYTQISSCGLFIKHGDQNKDWSKQRKRH